LVQWDEHLAESITVVVVDRNTGTIDRNLFKVGTAVAIQLCIEVGKEAALEERILGEVDTTDDMTRLELFLLGRDDLNIQGRLTITCSVSAK
jgi:hypothetical protein